MILLSLDLEMNQPSGKIIQIGACICDTAQNKILDELSVFINPEERVTDYIVNLTGIDQSMVDSGVSLRRGYELLSGLHARYGCYRNPLTWGGGDSAELMKQLGLEQQDFCFGRRWIDVKTIYQAYKLAMGKTSLQGGLKSALRALAITPTGQHHNALVDSRHTFFAFMKLCQSFNVPATASKS